MTSLLTTKTAGIIGGIVGVSTISAGAVYLSSNKTTEKASDKPSLVTVTNKSISELLKEESDVALIGENVSENGAWSTAWGKFKANYESKNLSKNWSSLASKKGESDIPAEFKSLCKTKSSLSVKDREEEIYKEVKEYCTKTKTASG